MRSEERSGIIGIVLLLLWGTPISEPFRYFASLIYDLFAFLLSQFKVNPEGKLGTIVIVIVMMAVAIALLLLTRMDIGRYIACVGACICLLVFAGRCLIAGSNSIVNAIILIAIVAIMAVLIVFKKEQPLQWLSDVYIFSIPMFVIVGLVFTPLYSLGGAWKVLAYTGRNGSRNLALCFDKFLTMPALVWGIFFAVLLTIPIVYYSFSRKKG